VSLEDSAAVGLDLAEPNGPEPVPPGGESEAADGMPENKSKCFMEFSGIGHHPQTQAEVTRQVVHPIKERVAGGTKHPDMIWPAS